MTWLAFYEGVLLFRYATALGTALRGAIPNAYLRSRLRRHWNDRHLSS